MKEHDDLGQIEQTFAQAEAEDRNTLLEPEGYKILDILGIEHPEYYIIGRDQPVDPNIKKRLRYKRIVVKVISPYIIHKTDFGGVRFCEGSELERTIHEMDKEVTDTFYRYVQKNPKKLPDKCQGMDSTELFSFICDSIKGYLVTPFIEFPRMQLGSEAIFGIKYTDDFGPILSFGLGGVDAEKLSSVTYPGVAITILSLDSESHPNSRTCRSSLWLDKVLGRTRGGVPMVDMENIDEVMQAFSRLGNFFSPLNPDVSYMIKELEINPLVLHEGSFLALDILVTFQKNRRLPRLSASISQIERMLKPESIGIIGVSEKMNVGHIILKNILREGFQQENIFVIKEGAGEIEGCSLYPTIETLPRKLDMIVLAIGAQQVWPLLQEIIRHNKAESILVVSGGLGEKSGSEDIPQKIKSLLSERRKHGKPTPIINGANSLGIISRPGKYDTLFIPTYKLPPIRTDIAPLAYISQSGAFMITRLSNLPYINAKYSISLGNQVDLTVSDFLEYFEQDADIKLVAVYQEGFQPLDGIRFKRLAERYYRKGKRILLYKAGRSKAGAAGVSGHTASIAGDYKVLVSVLSQVGVIIADTFSEFEDYVKIFTCFHQNHPLGRRIGAISNAGFESVGYADNIDDTSIKLASFQEQTVTKLRKIFHKIHIDMLVDIHNPLDITPMSNDDTFFNCVEALLEDENVDVGLVSFVPLTGALMTLPADTSHRENYLSPDSISSRIIRLRQKTKKPFMVTVDSGHLYDPVVTQLEKAMIPTFRSSDRAIKTLKRYLNSILNEHRSNDVDDEELKL